MLLNQITLNTINLTAIKRTSFEIIKVLFNVRLYIVKYFVQLNSFKLWRSRCVLLNNSPLLSAFCSLYLLLSNILTTRISVLQNLDKYMDRHGGEGYGANAGWGD